MREKNIDLITKGELEDSMSGSTLDLIEILCQYGSTGFSKTAPTFIDKIDFFAQLCECFANSQRPKDKAGSLLDQSTAGDKPMRQRRYSQRRLGGVDTSHAAISETNNDAYSKSIRNHNSSVSRTHHEDISDDDDCENPDNLTELQKTTRLKRKFKERVFQFLVSCLEMMSEKTLRMVILTMDQAALSVYIRMVRRDEFTRAVNGKSVEFKKFVIDSLMKKFVGIHLKTNK